jgi:hypothetical protein
METFLAICAIAVLIYGIRYTRRKAIRLQESDIQKSVERVKQQSINLSDYGTITNVRMELRANLRPAAEDETTPPSEPLADEDEGATEELDREAVFLAYLHLRETGILEE